MIDEGQNAPVEGNRHLMGKWLTMHESTARHYKPVENYACGRPLPGRKKRSSFAG